nr:class I tRNA ligase family protein [Mycoplasmopsis cynos]
MDYKNTLNMPQTDFEMRANLTNKEKYFSEFWLNNDIYNKVIKKNQNNSKFILHDGPPYANGDIHIGHALNKVLKDIIVRYKSLCGFYSPWVLGWDTHGLPIEHKMLSLANLNKEDLNAISLRKKLLRMQVIKFKIKKNNLLHCNYLLIWIKFILQWIRNMKLFN